MGFGDKTKDPGGQNENERKHWTPQERKYWTTRVLTTVEPARIDKGVKQGEALILLALLQEKVGPDRVDTYRERITAAEPEQLLQWSKRILSAETPEGIFH